MPFCFDFFEGGPRKSILHRPATLQKKHNACLVLSSLCVSFTLLLRSLLQQLVGRLRCCCASKGNALQQRSALPDKVITLVAADHLQTFRRVAASNTCARSAPFRKIGAFRFCQDAPNCPLLL